MQLELQQHRRKRISSQPARLKRPALMVSPGAARIVIPDTAAEEPDQGEIGAIGKGKILDDGNVQPLDLAAGDSILFRRYSGQAVKVDGEELLVMREEDVMGVVEGP
jgi:chaperonin GroES